MSASARTRLMLEGRVLPTLLRLSLLYAALNAAILARGRALALQGSQ